MIVTRVSKPFQITVDVSAILPSHGEAARQHQNVEAINERVEASIAMQAEAGPATMVHGASMASIVLKNQPIDNATHSNSEAVCVEALASGISAVMRRGEPRADTRAVTPVTSTPIQVPLNNRNRYLVSSWPLLSSLTMIIKEDVLIDSAG